MTLNWSNPLSKTRRNRWITSAREITIFSHQTQSYSPKTVCSRQICCNWTIQLYNALECDFMVFQRIFNAHTCLRQLRFVLNILPKLASLTCDQTQHRRFPSAHLKLHIISYYINNQKCRSEVCWRYVACCQVQIDRANTLEDYPRTHRRGFHQFNTKHQPQISCLVHFLKFDAVLWVFQRILMLLGCPFLEPQ